jgi:hypothetical protein
VSRLWEKGLGEALACPPMINKSKAYHDYVFFVESKAVVILTMRQGKGNPPQAGPLLPGIYSCRIVHSNTLLQFAPGILRSPIMRK